MDAEDRVRVVGVVAFIAYAVVVTITLAIGGAIGYRYAVDTARQATEPAALLPACDTMRVHHPDPRRLVRIIDCVTGDTTVESSGIP